MSTKSVQWPIGNWKMEERKQLSASISVIVMYRGGKRGYYGGEKSTFVEYRDQAEEMGIYDARRKSVELLSRNDIDRTEVESFMR